MSVELVFVIGDPMWLTSNSRAHWAKKSRIVKGLRHMAKTKARAEKIPTFETARVDYYVQYRTGGRADPANVYDPIIKSLIDGLVDAGVFPDDDHTHVMGPNPHRDPGKAAPGTHRVRLVITGQDVNF